MTDQRPTHLPASTFCVASTEKVAAFQPGRTQVVPSAYSTLLMTTTPFEFPGFSFAVVASTTLDGARGVYRSNSFFWFGFAFTTQKNCRSEGSGTPLDSYSHAKLVISMAISQRRGLSSHRKNKL